MAHGGVGGGFVLFVRGGRLCFTYNYVTEREFSIVADTDLPAGRHALGLEFSPTGPAEVRSGRGTPGNLRLFVDGQCVGGGELPVTIPLVLGGGLSIGADLDAPVTGAYDAPFPFTGKLDKVVYDVSGERVVDHEGDIRAALVRD